MWFKRLMLRYAAEAPIDQITPELLPFITNNLELDGYNSLYILFSRDDRIPLQESEAKRIIANAIIASLEDSSFSNLKQQIIIDASRRQEPFIEIIMDGTQLKLLYNGMPQGAGHFFEQNIQSQGYIYSQLPGAQRRRQRANEPHQPNQIERMEGVPTETYIRYANHLGYLIGHTKILVDHPQISERVDQDNPRRRMKAQDKYASSFEAFIRLSTNFGPEFLFAEVVDESGGHPFAVFKDQARVRSNALVLTRYEFVFSLVQYMGLDTEIALRPLPPGSPPEWYTLNDYADHVQNMLLRYKPDELSDSDLEQWYQYGIAGEII